MSLFNKNEIMILMYSQVELITNKKVFWYATTAEKSIKYFKLKIRISITSMMTLYFLHCLNYSILSIEIITSIVLVSITCKFQKYKYVIP